MAFNRTSDVFPAMEPWEYTTADNTAQTNQNPRSFDLNDNGYSQVSHNREFVITAKITTNGTAPGAADDTVTIHWAMLPEQVPAADIAEVTTITTSLECTLPNSADTTRWYQSEPFLMTGQYLHTWLDWSTRAATSQVTVELFLGAI